MAKVKTTIIPQLREVIYDTYANFPTAGLSVGDLGWATDRKCLYRWSGSAWESIGISSRHGDYADIGDPADYPESSLYQADDQDILYMVIAGAWESIVTPPQFNSQNVVTGSRALDTNYQNTHGAPILVMVTVNTTFQNSKIEIYCDSNDTPTTKVASQVAGINAEPFCVFFLVPDNYYYRLDQTDCELLIWVEYY